MSNVQSLTVQVPSLTYGELNGTPFVTIRGVGASVDNGIAEPSVATYADGVFLSRATMANLDFQDIERLEVLRGPQGTLYGRNASGGAVNFISRAPSDIFGGGIFARYGNYDNRAFSAYLTGPVADGVRVRVSGGRELRDGYVKSIVGGQDVADIDRWNVRGALELLPTENFEIDLTALYQKDMSNSAYGQLLTLPTSPLIPAGTITTTEPWRVALDSDSQQQKETLLLAGTINWKVGGVNLRSVTGYVDHSYTASYDPDGTNYPLFAFVNWSRPAKTFSQELNISGETGALRWLVGGYYFHEKFIVRQPILIAPGIAGFAPPGTITFQSLEDRTNAYALFTDLSYQLVPGLKLNGGLRYNSETRRSSQTNGAIIPGVGFVGDADIPARLKSSKLLPKIGIQYDIADKTNIYAQYQVGLKLGGQNLGAINIPYKPEILTAYETGIKGRIAGGSVTYTLAAFYYDYKDLQVSKFEGVTTSIVENGDARVYGAEAELLAALTPRLRVNVNGTVMSAKYTRFSSAEPSNLAAGQQDLKGNRLTRSPDYTISAGVEWHLPIGGRVLDDLLLRGEVFRSGKYALSPFDTQPGEPRPGYTLVNVSALLATTTGVQFRAFANNLTNEKYVVAALYSGGQGVFLGSYGPPRMYGLEARYAF